MNFNDQIFTMFDKKWALLTAGTEDNFNSMVIGWGGLGTIWGRPAATVYVRLSRYTHDFMDENEYFTISFYPDDCRKTLGVFGSKSGRDIDKMHYDGLTAEAAGESVTFKEAELTYVCRKLFRQRVELENVPDEVINQFYPKGDPHDMYIGEVVDIIQK